MPPTAAATGASASSVLAKENSRIMEFMSRKGRYLPHWSKPANGVNVTLRYPPCGIRVGVTGGYRAALNVARPSSTPCST